MATFLKRDKHGMTREDLSANQRRWIDGLLETGGKVLRLRRDWDGHHYTGPLAVEFKTQFGSEVHRTIPERRRK